MRACYGADLDLSSYHDGEGTSLWNDLDRDGVNTPAIPSFILNSPPMEPVTGEPEHPESLLHPLNKEHPEVTRHSLRKGLSFNGGSDARM